MFPRIAGSKSIKMKVLIADDHRLIIEGVKAKLEELDATLEAVGVMSVEEMQDAISAQADDFDLALVDLGMPGATGFQHIIWLRQQAPALPLIVLSGMEDSSLIRELLELGVMGFIPKAYSADVMLSAIRLVLAGGVYVPPMMLAQIEAQGWQPEIPATHTGVLSPPPIDALRELLTARQMDVVRLLSLGKPNKLIARELGISEGTVKIHLAAIFRALDVRNRVEAVVASRKLQGL